MQNYCLPKLKSHESWLAFIVRSGGSSHRSVEPVWEVVFSPTGQVNTTLSRFLRFCRESFSGLAWLNPGIIRGPEKATL